MAYAKCQKRLTELGQTGDSPFLHNSVYFNHITREARVLLPELGQTAVWPNTC
jgi:hypothetical protein